MALLEIFIIVALVGSGLNGGLFFIFSNCVMGSFEEMPDGEGMRAMQIINRRILNPMFLGVFAGTALVSLVVVVLAVMDRPPGSGFAVAGAACYLLGGFGVTAVGNVPLNNRLDQASIDTERGRMLWKRYLRDWTRWNHVRTVFCIAAVPLLALAL